MSAFLIALSTGLHVLATIVFVGYYLFTGLIGIYALSKEGQSLSDLFTSLYQRARGKA